ncbi:MAG: hypothetical protein HBSAPP02_13000 [Phycisphaerae bacterium]|nr:MAG: hypothetical protein HBSAPP02_13000 [Phycisphaerae bacterium]
MIQEGSWITRRMLGVPGTGQNRCDSYLLYGCFAGSGLRLAGDKPWGRANLRVKVPARF